MAPKTPHQPARQELGIAESFILLSLAWPVETDPLVAWSDADFGLAGAILIDLSLAGQVDSDLRNLIIHDKRPTHDAALDLAMSLLSRLGHSVSLDVALNTLVDRVGDLRAACLEMLAAKNISLTTARKLNWDFRQAAVSRSKIPEATELRRSLVALIESDEIPLPEQAAIISLLHGCEILGPVLAGKSYHHWILAYHARIETIRRLELVGHAVVTAVSEMRLRLRTYLLDALERQSVAATETPDKDKNYTRAKTTWEWRAFWPEGETVELPASWSVISDTVAVKEEVNVDNYMFVRGKKDNVKTRGRGLKVKPVLEAFDEFIAFGPSAKFSFPEKPLSLSVFFPRLFEVRRKVKSIDELLQVMSATGYQPSQITVSKTRQGLSMMFGVQIEFARIQVLGQVYHSISLESPYLTPLRVLARNIAVGRGHVAGYSDFLERILRSN